MQETKLRAWHKPTRRMLYFDNLWICTEYDSIAFDLAEASKQEEYKLWAGHSCLPSNDVAEYIFMLPTSLPDKNGDEIYEGDKLKYEVKGFPIRTAVVEASPGRFTFYWEDEQDGDFHKNALYVYFEKCWEIIGNIHENGELMKEGL